MKRPEDMTTDELYAELAVTYDESPFSADAPSPARFNNALLLTVTNPERLLGLTPRDCIDLCAANQACSPALMCLQTNANRSAGGWGEILRSSYSLSWFQWFVHSVEGVSEELRAIARVLSIARSALDAEEHQAFNSLQSEKSFSLQRAENSRYEATHTAQRGLLEYWASQHVMTGEQVSRELSRLSDKLKTAEKLGQSQEEHGLLLPEIVALLVKGEKPQEQTYLRALWWAGAAYRTSVANARAFYANDAEARKKHTARRMEELREAQAGCLILCSLLTRPLQTPKP
jgi:hypothetical protein